MIEEILKYFLGELKRLETHYDNQMRGFGNKIKTQRTQLINYEKAFKSKKVKAPKSDSQYREYCLVKDEIINKLNEKIAPLIEGNTFRDGHIGKLKAEIRDLQTECSNLMVGEEKLKEDVKLLTDIEANLDAEIKVLYEERERGDNPEWDCTDGAHPAWWRGERYSYLKFCERVTEFLDGKGFAGKGHVEIERIKRRIENMLVEAKSAENMNGLLIKTNNDFREENANLENTITALRTASKFKKEYDPKWQNKVKELEKENAILTKANMKDMLGSF